jgi:hypothetical protein
VTQQDVKEMAADHAKFLKCTTMVLRDDEPVTYNQLEYLLTQVFIHGFKHGVESTETES